MIPEDLTREYVSLNHIIATKGRNEESGNRFSKIKTEKVLVYIKWTKYPEYKNMNDKPYIFLLDWWFGLFLPFHESWEQILYQFNSLCVQYVDFRLSGLQRNNKFFEILTSMDNERHVCKCSLTCQDILNSLVTFSSIDSVFPFKSRQRRQCFKKIFLQIFVLFDNRH